MPESSEAGGGEDNTPARVPYALATFLLGIVVLLGATSDAPSRLSPGSRDQGYAAIPGNTGAPGRTVSRDPATGEQGYKRVVRLFRGHTDRVVYLRIAKAASTQQGRGESHRVGEEGGGSEESDEPPSASDGEQTVRSTVGHPYYVEGRGFVHAKDLKPGDQLRGSQGEALVVVGLAIKAEEADHYNFEVAEWHTYFVSETEADPAVWVHNAKCGVPEINKGFAIWFDKLSAPQLDKLWKNKRVRETIEDRLRHPGGMHEWLLVSKAPQFKRWGMGAEDIWAMRTRISKVIFKNPYGWHGGPGSTEAHNQIAALIDSAVSFRGFRQRLQNWAGKRLRGGARALPEGLRPGRG